MRHYVYILLSCLLLISCNENIDRHGNISFASTKGRETDVIFHNSNTTSLHDIGVFLSIDKLLEASPIRVELKVTAPNGNYWLDTLTIKNSGGHKTGFSGRKELYCKAYENVCLKQGGDYKFTTRTIDLKSELIYMIGIIIENK